MQRFFHISSNKLCLRSKYILACWTKNVSTWFYEKKIQITGSRITDVPIISKCLLSLTAAKYNTGLHFVLADNIYSLPSWVLIFHCLFIRPITCVFCHNRRQKTSIQQVRMGKTLGKKNIVYINREHGCSEPGQHYISYHAGHEYITTLHNILGDIIDYLSFMYLIRPVNTYLIVTWLLQHSASKLYSLITIWHVYTLCANVQYLVVNNTRITDLSNNIICLGCNIYSSIFFLYNISTIISTQWMKSSGYPSLTQLWRLHNRDAGDLRRHRAHCDVTVLKISWELLSLLFLWNKFELYKCHMLLAHNHVYLLFEV